MIIYTMDYIDDPEQHNAINSALSDFTYHLAVHLSQKYDPLGLRPNLVEEIVVELESDPEYLKAATETVLQDEEAEQQDPDNTNGVGFASEVLEGVSRILPDFSAEYLKEVIDSATKNITDFSKEAAKFKGVKSVVGDMANLPGALDVVEGVANYVASGFSPVVALEQYMNIATGAAVYAAAIAAMPAAIPAIVAVTVAGILAFGAGKLASAVTPYIAEGVEAAIHAAIAAYDAVTDAIALGYVALHTLGEYLQPYVDALVEGFQAIADWMQGVWDAFVDALAQASPLVLDLDGDGIELVSHADTTVYWDLDEDGFAEATGWVAPDDGLLAIDLDGNGTIDGHAELFGDSVYADGFAALSVYDTNADGVIDANDAQFADLLIWQDVNQNGISEADELSTLADFNITSINLNATSVNQTNEGNDILLASTFTMDDGVSGPQTLDIVDVWFTYDNVNTNFMGDYTLDIASLFVTTQRGYGNLPDLHVAASMDNDRSNPDSLMSLLSVFGAKDFPDLFVQDGSVLSDVRDIMFRWAGVDGVDPASRGDFVDARELGFLETMFDQIAYSGYNPGGNQGNHMSYTFDLALQAISSRLIGQAAGAQLFEGDFYYNPATDAFAGITGLSQAGLDTLLAKAQDAMQVTDKVAYWGDVVRVIDQVIGVENLSSGDATALETAITTSDATLSTQQILDTLIWNSSEGENISGTGYADTLDGSIGDDVFYGGNGDDVINGGIGADLIYGGNHNDTLDGQSGDDILYGGGGNDTYLYFAGHGHDSITEQGGVDKVLFGSGVTASDLTFTRVSNNALQISVSDSAGGGAVTIENQFTGYYIETAEFVDGSTLDLLTLSHTLTGTSSNDTLSGVRYGGAAEDTIYGMEGDDTITGYGNVVDYADNWLYGGAGNDSIYGAHGADTINGGDGDDYIRGYNGNDDVTGGLGDDQMLGYGGADTYRFNYGDGHDLIVEGNDYSVDKIVFGADITQDMIGFTRASNYNVTINIDGGLGGGITLQNQTYTSLTLCVETLEFADGSTIDITAQNLTLLGTAGNDSLYGVRYGAGQSDTIYGFEGDDIIYGYYGALDYADNWLYGGAGNDAIYGSYGIDTVEGGDGNDHVRGYNGDDEIHGGAGDDELWGGNNNDTLYGDAGVDILKGDNNDDILIGGLGADELWGGTGYDTFTFLDGESLDAVDTIKDFSSTYDVIDISDLLSAYDPLADAITDFVQITDDGTDSTLAVDLDGGADNFTAIALIAGRTGLTDEEALETNGTLIAA